MKPENKAHGQFTYFQAIIEDEYLLLDFNDKCSLHLSVTEDTLVQIYKKLDDLVLEEWEVGGDFMMEQQIEFTSNNELMLNFDQNYIFLKFSSKIEMKEFFAYFKKEIESSLELDKQSILKAEIIGDKTIVPEDNSLLRLNPQDIENFKIFNNVYIVFFVFLMFLDHLVIFCIIDFFLENCHENFQKYIFHIFQKS